MADKLSAAGVAVDSHLVDERNHFTLVLALAHPFQGAELDTLVAFIFRQASTPVE